MANGKVTIGFSNPLVAVYSASGNTVTYTGVIPMARGVGVEISLESGGDNVFHADNAVAERDAGRFTGGTATFTVDGLKAAAERLIAGLAAAEPFTVTSTLTVDEQHWGDTQTVPYVGVGFVVERMEEGVTSWKPIVLTKLKFDTAGLSAQTQGQEIDWQTTELTAAIERDDSARHDWKRTTENDLTTEADAIAYITKVLGGTVQ